MARKKSGHASLGSLSDLSSPIALAPKHALGISQIFSQGLRHAPMCRVSLALGFVRQLIRSKTKVKQMRLLDSERAAAHVLGEALSTQTTSTITLWIVLQPICFMTSGHRNRVRE